MENIKGWLTSVVSGLVSKPESINIEVSQDEMGVLFKVSVDKEDTGKIIGKKGATAEAIRVLTRSAGFLQGMRASVQIIDAPFR